MNSTINIFDQRVEVLRSYKTYNNYNYNVLCRYKEYKFDFSNYNFEDWNLVRQGLTIRELMYISNVEEEEYSNIQNA